MATTPTPGPCTASGDDHRIERACDGDAEQIATVLASAFVDYAWTNWIVPPADRRHRLRRLHLLTTQRVGLPFGEVWVARCPARSGQVAGAAIGLRPDRDIPGRVWMDLAPLQTDLLGERADAAETAEEKLSQLRPDVPLLVLATLGVAPDHWRRGLATRLLRPLLELADVLSTPTYLETSSSANVGLYTRAGFSVLARSEMPEGGPTVWAMHRPPARRPGIDPAIPPARTRTRHP